MTSVWFQDWINMDQDESQRGNSSPHTRRGFPFCTWSLSLHCGLVISDSLSFCKKCKSYSKSRGKILKHCHQSVIPFLATWKVALIRIIPGFLTEYLCVCMARGRKLAWSPTHLTSLIVSAEGRVWSLSMFQLKPQGVITFGSSWDGGNSASSVWFPISFPWGPGWVTGPVWWHLSPEGQGRLVTMPPVCPH